MCIQLAPGLNTITFILFHPLRMRTVPMLISGSSLTPSNTFLITSKKAEHFPDKYLDRKKFLYRIPLLKQLLKYFLGFNVIIILFSWLSITRKSYKDICSEDFISQVLFLTSFTIQLHRYRYNRI